MNLLSSFVESFFFQCDNRSYWIPQHFGLKGEYFFAESPEKKKRISAGLICHPDVEPKATVLYFYAGLRNWQFNLPQVLYLLLSGYQVAVFDYAGAGASEGSLTLDGIGEDAQIVLDYLKAHQKYQGKLLIFAQGVGCDAALRLCHANENDVGALVMESPYHSRKGWLLDHWGPIVGDMASWALKTETPEPKDIVTELSIPTLVFFPERNSYLPEKQKKAFIGLLNNPAAAVTVPKKDYLAVFTGDRNREQDKALNFFEKHLT